MFLENTDKLLHKKLDNQEFDSYGVLVFKDENSEFLHSSNVNADTYFDIASMGKVLITATLILKAVGDKKLTIDDTLDRFFSDVPPEKKNITIFRLLTHTSGIIRHEIPAAVAENGSAAIARHILSFPLAFEPGTAQIYSCNAYILLGFIVEKIYGMPLDETFYTYIKAPLGLTRSRFNIAVDEENAAVSYKRRDVGEYRADDENVYVMKGIGGNGAQFWTMADIRRFTDAVMAKSDKLYPEWVYTAAEKDYAGSIGEAWGLGWLVTDKNYTQTGRLFPLGSFGHCGHTGCSFFMNREKNMYVIILTNATRFLNMKNNFNGYDYGVIMKMREDIHNEIYKDLQNGGLL